MTSAITASMLHTTLQRDPLDLNQPYRTRDGRKPLNVRLEGSIVRFSIEGERNTLTHTKYAANGCSYPAPRDNQLLGDDLVNIVPDTTYTRRSLRPDRTYQLRDGRPVEIVSWDADPLSPIVAMFTLTDNERARFPGRSKLVVEYHKSGRLNPNAEDSPHDILEINPVIVKWVRAYDPKPLDETGKQVVSGRKFNSAIPLHWYLFDTEAEARASLQGVRAVFRIEYVEGDTIA